MKTAKIQTIEDKINYIQKTIQRLGVCSIRNDKLTEAELATLKEHFTVEQFMGYSKFF
jgi:hypothetical protein